MKLKRYVTVLAFCLFCVALIAQQNGYLIRNYLPKEYGGYSQIWKIQQDKNGLMYFAGTTNVFIYDGVTWDKVQVKQGAATRQIAYDSSSGTVYCGAVSDLGYLQRAFDGKWMYISLLEKIPEQYRTFADIWKVYFANGRVYFQASERIFIFKDGKFVGTIEAGENTFALSFYCDDRLFVRQRNVGLHELINDKLVLLPGGEAYATVPLLNILPWRNDSALLFSYSDGITAMTMHAVKPGNSIFGTHNRGQDEFLLQSGVLGSRWVNDSIYVVFSRSGLGFYGRDGVLREIINRESGITDESVSEIFVDREQNIWLASNYGISRIAYNNPVYYYESDGAGLKGSFEYMIHHNQRTFVGTMDGLWVNKTDAVSSPSRLQFESFSKRKMECWSVGKFGTDLIFSTGVGLLRLKGNDTEIITDRNTSLFTTTQKPGELITGEVGGVTFIEMKSGEQPTRITHAEMPSEEIMRISPADTVQDQPEIRDFWCVNRFRNLFHVRMNIISGEYESLRYDTINGLPNFELFPIKLNDTVYFLNYHNCYRYHPDRDTGPSSACFTIAPDIYEQVSTGDISGLHPPFDYRLFIYSQDDSATVFGKGEDGTLIRERFLMNQVDITDVQFAFAEPGHIVWLMTLDKILRVDLNRVTNKDRDYHAMISSVFIGDDSVLFYGSGSLNNTLPDALPYNFNSVSFAFAAPFFDHENQLRYSYMLEGYDTAWSKWSTATRKDYTNLPEGSYTFKVKAQNIFERESTVGTYALTILPPWYRTAWAYSMYAMIFIGTLWGSVRLSARRLRKQKEKLEQVVRERTAEVVEQKQQIEAQKVDLEVAYTGIQDSIHYSQRIQQAILPTHDDIRKIVPDSFLLFYPRDIVSGDFYWIAEKGGTKFIACVDCTGHGVPGALMSMIGNTLLNQIILEKNITSPDEALNNLHIGVRHALKQDAGGDTRDGMDIALVAISSDGKSIQYAGANRNLWIVRKGELLETKADKCPIAGSQQEEERRFTKHSISLERGDCIYLTTDGYADQFGGPRGKKFMVKQLSGLLVEMHEQPMHEQHTILEHKFNEWKSNHEQVDDVLVIGIRAS